MTKSVGRQNKTHAKFMVRKMFAMSLTIPNIEVKRHSKPWRKLTDSQWKLSQKLDEDVLYGSKPMTELTIRLKMSSKAIRLTLLLPNSSRHIQLSWQKPWNLRVTTSQWEYTLAGM